MTISPQNIQWPTGASYLIGDRGTGAWGVKDVSPFIPDVLTGSEDFETDPISGSGTWTLTSSSPHTGLRCLRSGVIGNNANTDYVFNVPIGTNYIRFWHRVSTELNFDFFRVYKDAIIPGNLLFQTSGTANVWAMGEFNITGVATITFRYIKDGSSIGGLDTCFIDDIEWIGTLGQAAVQVYEPLHLNTNNELKVTVGNFPVNVNLDCATDSVTICPGDDPIEVIVNNFPVQTPLDCATDSVTICPGVDPIEVIVNNFPVSTPLDCTTDSVTICPGDDPIEVIVNNFPTQTPLDCATDSVTICPGDDPIEVIVNNFPVSTPLDCVTDSVTVCPGDDPLEVVVNNFPAVAHLDCTTDSVGACQEGDWTVGVEGEVDVNVVGGTITVVPGKRTLTGLYYATGGPYAYTTAADTATGGEIWLVNTSASVIVYLRSVRFTTILNSLAILTALPTIRLERMTFTGTPSGAQITPAKRDSTDPTNTGTIRTASTGMTPSAGAAIHSFSPPTADVIGGLLAVNATSTVPVEQLFEADLESYIVLRQNEGVVIRQSTAGNATENRQYWLNVVWEEI
jgi:hypothetical protein